MWGFVKRLLFLLDAELAHRVVMRVLGCWSRVCRVELSSHDVARHPSLTRNFFGLIFPNPLGLAAGFDKNAEAVPAWESLGFGFIEIGTVTPQPQIGNPKPRLFRLVKDQAILNRMGFNNEGAEVVAKRLEKLRKKNRIRVPLGVNIGKGRDTPIASAAGDYLEAFTLVADVADYIVINISSPNTVGLRDLQQEDHLQHLLDVVAHANQSRRIPRPLLLKLSPDIPLEQAVDSSRLAVERGLSGLIVTNTTISREKLIGPIPDGPGGISGRPLFEQSTLLLRHLAKEFTTKLVLIGVGGVMDEETARAKFEAGASLIQTYTGFVYGGPAFPRKILKAIRHHRGGSLLPSP